MYKFCSTLILVIILLPFSVMAESTNLFTLHRINYKPFKQLRYDLNYNKKDCTINTSKPLDVYYENIPSKQRINKFSSNSRKYFAPSWRSANISPRKFSFSFKALEEIKQLLGSSSKLTVYLDQVGNECQVTTEVTYTGVSFDLRHIAVDVKLSFGLPTGVHSVELQGVRQGSYFVRKIQGN